jgi:hypothetical protein
MLSRVNEPRHSPAQPPDIRTGEQGIMSTRSLVILAISAATALLAGASAGASAAIATPDSLGVAGRVAIGLLAALVAGIVIGLTTAGTLNSLVNRP